MEDYKENTNYKKYIYEDKKIKPINITDEFDMYIYKANMGMGKTESLTNIIDKYKKILIISFRISLDVQYVEQFDGFELYSDLGPTIDLDINNKVVMQINSLHKIRGQPDLIILDEVTYTLDTLVGLEKHKDLCYEYLEQLLKSNTKIIVMDALLEKDIMNWITSFNKSILYIENNYKKHKDLIVNNYDYHWSQFHIDMLNDIKIGKKIAFVTNSRARMLFIKDKIKNNNLIKESLFIDKDSEDKYNIEMWDKVDFLSYTPTITAGVSFKKKHYDKVYGYFINN